MTILYDQDRIQKLITDTDPKNLNPDFRATFLGIVDWINSGKAHSLRQIAFLEKQHKHHKLIKADRRKMEPLFAQVDIESLNSLEKNMLDGIKNHLAQCRPVTDKQVNWVMSKTRSEVSKY